MRVIGQLLNAWCGAIDVPLAEAAVIDGEHRGTRGGDDQRLRLESDGAVRHQQLMRLRCESPPCA